MISGPGTPADHPTLRALARLNPDEMTPLAGTRKDCRTEKDP